MQTTISRFKIRRFIPACVLAGLLTMAAVAQAVEVRTYYYQPENITGIAGRTFADTAIGTHLLELHSYGAGPNALAVSVTTRVSDFTKSYPPSPLQNYQRGIDNQYVHFAGQMHGSSEAGMHNHTFNLPSHPANNLVNFSLAYGYTAADNYRPWATYEDAELVFECRAQVPGYYMTGTGTCGYFQTGTINLFDTGGTPNIHIEIMPGVFDTRGAPDDENPFFYGWPCVGTFFDPNNQTSYMSKLSDSYSSTGTPWTGWRKYAFSINRDQLANVINDINFDCHDDLMDHYGRLLTTNPANYRLGSFTVQNEIYWPVGGNGWQSSSVKEMKLYHRHWE